MSFLTRRFALVGRGGRPPVKSLVSGGYRFCKGDLSSAGAHLTTARNRGSDLTKGAACWRVAGPKGRRPPRAVGGGLDGGMKQGAVSGDLDGQAIPSCSWHSYISTASTGPRYLCSNLGASYIVRAIAHPPNRWSGLVRSSSRPGGAQGVLIVTASRAGVMAPGCRQGPPRALGP